MKIYDASAPDMDNLYDRSNVNHIAWSLLVVTLGLIFWLTLALINAENQRYALLSKQCVDPVFKAETDLRCLHSVQSREHWWQHVTYALRHVKPE